MAVEGVMRRSGRLMALAAAAAVMFGTIGAIGAAPAHAQAGEKPPSTFSAVIGSALLCRDQVDNAYFHAWLTRFFGPAYKHEGGAYWFRTTDASLWGTPVSEVMVSDDTSELAFVAAVSEVPPDELEGAIRKAVGVRYLAVDASPYPVRASNGGSKIAYYITKSKIYCAKFKSLPPRP